MSPVYPMTSSSDFLLNCSSLLDPENEESSKGKAFSCMTLSLCVISVLPVSEASENVTPDIPHEVKR